MDAAVEGHPLIGLVCPGRRRRGNVRRSDVSWPDDFLDAAVLTAGIYLPESVLLRARSMKHAAALSCSFPPAGQNDRAKLELRVVAVSRTHRGLEDVVRRVRRMLSSVAPALARIHGGAISGFVLDTGDGARRLPAEASSAISPEHVNGGVSQRFVGDDSRAFVVYRRQDMEKVLVHELLHNAGVDDPASFEACRDASLRVQARHAVTCGGTGLRLSEAYVDALAVLVHAAARSRTRSELSGNLASVVDHALCVAARVVNHFGRWRWPATGISETTHAFAYYVAKAALLASPAEVAALPARVVDVPGAAAVIAAIERALHADAFVRALEAAVLREAGNRDVRMVPRSLASS